MGPVFREVGETIKADLERAEAIAFAITVVLLVLVFGGVVAASLPLIIGIISILGTFLALRIISSITDVSVYALNMTTVMGLGLAIDYSLFVLSRFREELGDGDDVLGALTTHDEDRGPDRDLLGGHRRGVAERAADLPALLPALVRVRRHRRGRSSRASARCIVLPAILAGLGRNVDALVDPPHVATRAGRQRRLLASLGHDG